MKDVIVGVVCGVGALAGAALDTAARSKRAIRSRSAELFG